MIPIDNKNINVKQCENREINILWDTPNLTGIDFRLLFSSLSKSKIPYNISNPVTQNNPPIPRSKILKENRPVKAILTAGGTIRYIKPRQRWHNHVNLFV